MVVHTKDNSLHEWDLTTREETRSWPSAEGRYTGVLSPDGNWHLISIQNPDTRTITSLTDLTSGHQMDLQLPWFYAASFSPDGRLFALGSWEGDTRLFETAAAKEVARLKGILGSVWGVGFSPDGRLLMTGHGSGGSESVALWDMEGDSHEKLLMLEGQGSMFEAVAFSPDGNVLAAVNQRGVMHLWRAPSWAEIEATEQAQGTPPQRR
jgi:WD40 repeat protein